ncbi:MAG: ATP-dependent zinc metalloprotease FtsH [Planctomycetes bacterium]|nr:ATP-dependent zinc metalloprotease FtsH [Planctomycetota bacterium]
MDKKVPRRRSWLLSNVGVVVVVALFVVISLLFNRESPAQNVPYGKFRQMLQTPGVTFRHLKVGRTDIRGEVTAPEKVVHADGTETETPKTYAFRTSRLGVERDQSLFDLLAAKVPDYEAESEESPAKSALSFVGWMLAAIITLLLAIVVMRWLFGTGGSPFSFGKTRHKVFSQKDSTITFEDVAGIDEAKAELREVVDFLKTPEKYQALGGRIPKGVLLVGPPGTGKTLLARSVAGEAGVPFFSISGSDFVELFAGVGASRVRELFREAVVNAPCIIFIDELDAMGKSRSNNAFASHEEREQTLNQLLVEMDGFDTNKGVIIMAATNRPEILDAALLRPGRFDRTVVVDRPDVVGREAILKVHARTVKLSEDVNLRKIAALTPGSAGADLANLVNEAALLAARRGKVSVGMNDFEEAVERGAVGLERRSRIMRPEEKRRVAYHEAGHALIACAVQGSDPVHKVSIIPRGMAGGYVLQRPDEDRTLMTRGELEARIKVALGGTLAEELILSDISTGATSDLQAANDIAGRMVREFGMSRLGRIYLSGPDSNSFLPGFGDAGLACSEATAREIDLEIRRIIDTCLQEVKGLLARSRMALEAVAQRLIDKEVIDGPELLQLLTCGGFEPNESARRMLLEQHTPLFNTDSNGNGVAGPVIHVEPAA